MMTERESWGKKDRGRQGGSGRMWGFYLQTQTQDFMTMTRYCVHAEGLGRFDEATFEMVTFFEICC